MKRIWKMVMAFLVFAVLAGFHAETAQAKDWLTDIPETTEERIEKAYALGLEEWIDSEGYLVEEFLEGRPDDELSEMNLFGLVRMITEEELDAYVAQLNAGIMLCDLTFIQRLDQYDPGLGYSVSTGVYEVDGHLACCIERSMPTPSRYSKTSEWQVVTNEKIRKVLYYGYNGPKDKGYTFVETSLAAAEANGDGKGSLGQTVLAEIVKYASPPDTFVVWKVEVDDGERQDLAFYTIETEGYASLKKVSSDTSITDGNTNYSFLNAIYGVYSDSKCTNLVGELITSSAGTSNTLTLEAGTYYVKEITAPKGYLLSETKKKITVEIVETTTVTMSDVPKTFAPEILVQKLDAETGKSEPQGIATLEGAQFSVKFYAGGFSEGVDPAYFGNTPTREWIMQTDAKGQIYMSEDYLVSGDEFWKDSSGNVVFPLGTVTIQEIVAPDGYCLNSEVFVRKLKSSDEVFEVVYVEDTVRKLELLKLNDLGEPLKGVEFTLYSDAECTKAVSKGETDEDGQLPFAGLKSETTYYLKETKAPEGYRISETVYEIYFDGTEDAGVIQKTIINERTFKLPETGASGALTLGLIGAGCLVLSKQKTRRKQNEK